MQYVIVVEPWPTPDSPPVHWQVEVSVDGEIVAEGTGPGGVLRHFYQGVELLNDYLAEGEQ